MIHLIFYPLLYLLSLFLLVFWFLNPKLQWVKKGFFISLLGYLGMVILSEATLPYKVGTLFRDLLVLSASGMLFGFLVPQSKLAKAMAFVVFSTGVYVLFFGKLQKTFPQELLYNLDKQGELLMQIQEQEDLAKLGDIFKEYDLKISPAFQPASPNETTLDDYYMVDVPDHLYNKVVTIRNLLSNSGFTVWVEENELVQSPELVPTEVRGNRINYMVNDPSIQQQWGFDKMQVNEWYSYMSKHNVTPQKKALIAILDTGVDSKHEDIKGRFKSLGSKHNNDAIGHGTHCAGVAAAVTNNGIGIASFAPNSDFVEVTSVKVLGNFGVGSQKSIIDGIILAADKGADVINMSLGGRSSHSRQVAYNEAVAYANKKGAIVIVAAGNENTNATNITPANAKGVIAVSALDEKLDKAAFSNTVADIEMAVAAPGVDIFSTIPADKYIAYSGTSMAAPHVTGLVAVLKSLQPDLTTKQVYDILHKTGKPTSQPKLTGRFIQPSKAIREILD